MIDRVASLLKIQKPEMNRGYLIASGTVVPTDATDGYQTGCIFFHTDGTNNTSLYVNEGSVTSCDFNAITTGGPADVLVIGAFASLLHGSGIAISSSQPYAAAIYSDDNNASIGNSVRGTLSRFLLTKDQAGGSIRALMGQLKLATGVDVGTGIYTANQGYVELAGTHSVNSSATFSCFDASLEVGTALTVASGGEACGVHVEVTGSGTITNNGTCAAILIDNASGAAEWPCGIYMPGPDVTTGIRIGDWVASAATTGGVKFGTDMDVYSDGQLDVMQVHGATDSLISGSYSAKCGRFRHVVQVSGTLEAEVYGAVGQVVAKTVVLGLYAAGLMGTIESDGGFHVGDGDSPSYPCCAGVIGRPGGSSITIDSRATLAGVAALSNVTSPTVTGDYAGLYVALCQASCTAFEYGLLISSSSVTTGVSIGACTTGLSIVGAATTGISIGGTGTVATGISIDPTTTTKAIVLGTESSSASGSGLPVSASASGGLHYGTEFYFDDGGVALTTGWLEAFRVGYLVSTTVNTTSLGVSAFHAYTYLANSVTIGTDGGMSGAWGSLLVKTGKTITISSGVGDFAGGHFSIDVPNGATIGTGTHACGVSVGGNLGGTHTGSATGFRVRAPSAGTWDYGLSITNSACVTGISIGTCTTGVAITGATGQAIDIQTTGVFRMGVEGTGIPVNNTYPYGLEIHTKTISDFAQPSTGVSAGIYSRYEHSYDQTTATGHAAVFAKLRVKQDLADGVHAGVYGYVEISGTTEIGGTATTQTCAGHFAVEAPSTLNLSTGHLNGIVIDCSVDDEATITGTMSGIRIKKSAGCHAWPTGIAIDDSATTTAIDIGTATTGISIGAGCTNGIQQGAAATSAGSGITIAASAPTGFYFDDGGAAITAYREAMNIGLLLSTASESGTQTGMPSALHVYTDQRANYTGNATNSMTALWASYLVRNNSTLDGFDNKAVSAIQASVDIEAGSTVASGTTLAGVSIGGNLPGTLSGKAVPLYLSPMNESWSAFMKIDESSVYQDAPATGGSLKYLKVYIGDTLYTIAMDTT